MFDLLDDAALRTRAQLAADAHIAGLRLLTRKPVLTAHRVRAALVVALMVLVGLAGLASLAVGVVGATSCVSEDSTRAQLGTDRFGCVWWAGLQGNGEGRTVWNRPNG